jgi:cytochrome c oxidase subunit 3
MSSRQIAISGALRPERSETGAWIGISALAMCFAALASAMVVRQGASAEWLHFELPRVLYAAAAILLVSSVTMEFARRRARKAWLLATAALGVATLCCIYIAWRELGAQGVLLATSGSASFFYVFTAACCVCIAGGLLAVLGASMKAARLGALAIYWHFVVALWLFVFLLLEWRI